MSYFVGQVDWVHGDRGETDTLVDWTAIKIRSKLDSNTNQTTIELKNDFVDGKPLRIDDDGNLLGAYVGDDGDIEFNSEKNSDVFKVYAAWVSNNRVVDTSSGSDDLLTTAELREVKIKATADSFPITAVCEDQTYTILGRIWAQNFTEVITGTLTSAGGSVLTDSGASFETELDGLKGRIIRLGQDDTKIYLIQSNTATAITTYDDSTSAVGTEGYEIFWTAPSAIRELIRHATDSDNSENQYDESGAEVKNGVFKVDARFELLDTANGGGHITVKRPDGSNFPPISYTNFMKPVYDFVDELSQLDYTNTTDEMQGNNSKSTISRRRYRFRIDEQNRFRWFYPRDSVTTFLNGALNDSATTINVDSASSFASSGRLQIDSEWIDYTGTTSTSFTGCTRGANNSIASSHSDNAEVFQDYNIIVGDTSTGFTVIDADLTKKVFDVVNHVLFRAGNDMNGSAIVDHYFHEETTLGVLRSTEKPYEEIAKELKLEDYRKAQQLTLTGITPETYTSGNTASGNNYDFPSAYGDYDSDDPLPAWNPSEDINDDSGYNTSFRNEAIRRGQAKARALCELRSKARWTGKIELKGVKLLPGEGIVFTSSRHGINRVSLRITGVTHNITKNGWFTTIEVEEDDSERQISQ